MSNLATSLLTDPLFRLVRPERRTAVVDVGANPIDGDPPYRTLLAERLCTVVGFEPQAEALARLQSAAGPLETYLPQVIGDGADATLHVCAGPGLTSLLKPDERALALFPLFSELGRVVATEPLRTVALDSVEAVTTLDFLKLDVQGSELAILQHTRRKLADAVVVQAEVSFLPLYQNQPTFGEIDQELRSQGFISHTFAAVKRWVLAPMVVNGDPREPLNQLLEADAVYVRDFRRPDRMTSEQFKHLALIAHHCYRSFDLTLLCLRELANRGDVRPDVPGTYLELLASGFGSIATP